MYRLGHTGIGLLLGAAAIWLANLPSGAFIALGIIVTTVLPDIDQRIDSLSHRGVTHTVLFGPFTGLFVGVGVFLFIRELNTRLQALRVVDVTLGDPGVIGALVGIGGCIGVLGHIMGDILTIGGQFRCRPLWPISSAPIALGLCTAKNTAANEGLFTAGALALALAIQTLPSV